MRTIHQDLDTGVIVVTDDRTDRPKLKRRGFFTLTPKRAGPGWYEFAMTLAPGVYTVADFGEPGFTIKSYEWSPLHYSVKQWRGLQIDMQAKAWDGY